MAFNIDNFIGNLSKYGTLQTNRFEVSIPLPLFLSASRTYPDGTAIPTFPSDLLHMRAESVKVPSLVFDTVETKRYGIGPSQKTAVNVKFEPISISFIETYDNKIKKIFYDWSRFGIFNFAGSPQGVYLGPSFLTGYKDDYCVDIEIKVYNTSGKNPNDPTSTLEVNPINKIKLVRAFPISVSDSDLSWGDNNSLYKLNVSFTYDHYEHIIL